MLSESHFCFKIEQQLKEITAPIKQLFDLQDFFVIRYFKTEDDSRSSSYFFPNKLLLEAVLKNIGGINTRKIFQHNGEIILVREAIEDIKNASLKRHFVQQTRDEIEQFNIGFSLNIRRCHNDYTDFFMFMSKADDRKAACRLTSNIDSLQHAIEFFYDHGHALLAQGARHRVNYSTQETSAEKCWEIDKQAFLAAHPISKIRLRVNGRIMKLSHKDLQCAELLIRGYTQKAIAEQLFLSPRTIESRVDKLKEQFHCFSIAELRSVLATHLARRY